MNGPKNALYVIILSAVLSCYLAFSEGEDDEALTSDRFVDDVIEKIMDHKNDPNPMITKRSYQGECNDLLKFPETTNIQTVNNNRTVDAANDFANIVPCAPRKFPIKIPADINLNIFPTVVDLKRCFGETYSRHSVCVAQQKERVKVSYRDTKTNQIGHVQMWEHTQCGLECIVKQEDCNKDQVFENCECKCTLPSNTTCSDNNKTWHEHECACICSTVQDCPLYQEFNRETCSCECAKCIRDMCTKANYVLDTNTCQCVSSSG